MHFHHCHRQTSTSSLKLRPGGFTEQGLQKRTFAIGLPANGHNLGNRHLFTKRHSTGLQATASQQSICYYFHYLPTKYEVMQNIHASKACSLSCCLPLSKPCCETGIRQPSQTLCMSRTFGFYKRRPQKPKRASLIELQQSCRLSTLTRTRLHISRFHKMHSLAEQKPSPAPNRYNRFRF